MYLSLSSNNWCTQASAFIHVPRTLPPLTSTGLFIFFNKLCFFLNTFIYVFIFGCAGPSVLFSGCGEWGLLSSCDVGASHCSGFSRFRALALGHTSFSGGGSQALERSWIVVAHGCRLLGTWDLPTIGFRLLGTWDLPTIGFRLLGMWDLPTIGIEPVSPALEDLPLSHQRSPPVAYF